MANELADGQERYNALLELAGGDADLVQKAIDVLALEGDDPQYEDIATVVEEMRRGHSPVEVNGSMELDQPG